MRYIYETARYMTGGIFIFSGAIKVNDPIGTSIKLQEYFEVFAHDIAPFFGHLAPASLFFSVFLSVLEVILGIALIIGFKIPRTSRALLIIIVFFTFLTFYSAYFNKVTDCGCFGDAIKLAPWESFAKDVVLLAMIVAIYTNRHRYGAWFSERIAYIKVMASTVFFTSLAFYAIHHLPFIDFRPYAIGNHLPALMKPSEEPVYQYVMEKDGQEYIFDAYPDDKGYTFKSMDLTNPDALPKITDLNVWTNEGDYTEELLRGNKLLIVVYSADKASVKNIEAVKKLINAPSAAEPWILTASGHKELEELRHREQLAAPYYFADATVLKTMIRANPGVVLLKNGTVLGKWHHNDVPDISKINQILY